MRRMIAYSREFNKKRMVFGKLAAENKLQASVLFDMVIATKFLIWYHVDVSVRN